MLQSSFLEKINTSPKVCKKDEARKCEKCLKNAVPEECMEEYVVNKVETWFEEIQVLANIASTLPHAVYSAFVHGVTGQWSFVSKTILPDIQGLLQPLEDAIHQLLIPALTGRPPCSKNRKGYSFSTIKTRWPWHPEPICQLSINLLCFSHPDNTPRESDYCPEPEWFCTPQSNTVFSIKVYANRQGLHSYNSRMLIL